MRALLICLLLAGPAWAQAGGEWTPDAILTEFLWDRFLALPKAERPLAALVFSGGGARAMANAGVLEVLEREGFDFDIVAGTSMGAMIGALYASGLTASQIRALAPKMQLSSREVITPGGMLRLLLRDRLINTQGFETFLSDAIGERRFDQLERRFGCVATDLRTGEKIIFREGALAPAVRASMNIPGFFEPVQYRHRFLVDGGVVDYVPVDVARGLGAEWILASVAEADVSNEEFDSVFKTLEQVIDIRGRLLSAENLRAADVVIRPAAGHLSTFDFARAQEAMNLGVLAGQKRAAAAKQSLALKSLPQIHAKWRKP